LKQNSAGIKLEVVQVSVPFFHLTSHIGKKALLFLQSLLMDSVAL